MVIVGFLLIVLFGIIDLRIDSVVSQTWITEAPQSISKSMCWELSVVWQLGLFPVNIKFDRGFSQRLA